MVVIAVVFSVGGFFGGMQYGKSAEQKQLTSNFRSSGNGTFVRRGGANGGGFTNGQIISKDSNSITLQTMGGGSKIVFLAGSTQIAKSAQGTADDLTTGEGVVVTGTANSDGSITAQNIQIRPANMSPAGQSQGGGTQQQSNQPQGQ